MSFRSRTRPYIGTAIVSALVATLVVVPATLVIASHQFSDVPDDHTHHATIAASKNAGITSGCTASTYCPQDPVTRGQMASFMHRALGRVTRGDGLAPIPLGGTEGTLGSVSIDIPGVGGPTTQFVKVDAVYELDNEGTGCPCEVEFRLRDPVTGAGSQYFAEGVGINASPEDESSGAVSWVFFVPSGALNRTFELRARVDSGAPTALAATWSITAITAPFGRTGGNSL